MKVKALIEQLKNFPEDAEVIVIDQSEGCLARAELLTVYDADDDWYDFDIALNENEIPEGKTAKQAVAFTW